MHPDASQGSYGLCLSVLILYGCLRVQDGNRKDSAVRMPDCPGNTPLVVSR
jgi:hypothetical protein